MKLHIWKLHKESLTTHSRPPLPACHVPHKRSSLVLYSFPIPGLETVYSTFTTRYFTLFVVAARVRVESSNRIAITATGTRKITEPGTHMIAPAAAWSSSAVIPQARHRRIGRIENALRENQKSR